MPLMNSVVAIGTVQSGSVPRPAEVSVVLGQFGSAVKAGMGAAIAKFGLISAKVAISKAMARNFLINYAHRPHLQ